MFIKTASMPKARASLLEWRSIGNPEDHQAPARLCKFRDYWQKERNPPLKNHLKTPTPVLYAQILLKYKHVSINIYSPRVDNATSRINKNVLNMASASRQILNTNYSSFKANALALLGQQR